MKRLKHNVIDEIRDYLYNQSGIEIDRYRNQQTEQFDTNRMLFLDWDSIPRKEQQYIEDAIYAPYSPYKMQDAGTWMKCIMAAKSAK